MKLDELKNSIEEAGLEIQNMNDGMIPMRSCWFACSTDRCSSGCAKAACDAGCSSSCVGGCDKGCNITCVTGCSASSSRT